MGPAMCMPLPVALQFFMLLTYRYPTALTACFNLSSSAVHHTPFFRCPGILLHLLRQSLFVRPGSFAAMRFQSLRLPWFTEKTQSSFANSAKLVFGLILTLIFCFLPEHMILFFCPPPTDARGSAHLINLRRNQVFTGGSIEEWKVDKESW